MILKLVRTLATYLLVGLLVIIFAIPCLIFILLPARWRYDNKLFFWMSHIFYKLTLWFTFLPIEFIGKENIPKEPSIIAPNHQSALDVPLVGVLLNGRPHLWMAWSALTRYWIGPVISRMAVLLDVSSPMKASRSLVRGIKMFKDKNRYAIIFPEGSRSKGNQVSDFFAGFVMLAKKAGRPVVPVLILNAYKAYPPGAFFINWCKIKVIVGKPFLYKESDEGDDAFKKRVRDWFVQTVEKYET
ncbi:lysophospholipid acyltransferase family protein [Candidatus Dependentiae bacterium]